MNMFEKEYEGYNAFQYLMRNDAYEQAIDDIDSDILEDELIKNVEKQEKEKKRKKKQYFENIQKQEREIKKIKETNEKNRDITQEELKNNITSQKEDLFDYPSRPMGSFQQNSQYYGNSFEGIEPSSPTNPSQNSNYLAGFAAFFGFIFIIIIIFAIFSESSEPSQNINDINLKNSERQRKIYDYQPTYNIDDFTKETTHVKSLMDEAKTAIRNEKLSDVLKIYKVAKQYLKTTKLRTYEIRNRDNFYRLKDLLNQANEYKQRIDQLSREFLKGGYLISSIKGQELFSTVLDFLSIMDNVYGLIRIDWKYNR